MANKDARYFQWIVGEKKGEIVIFDKIISEDGMIFITFTDGSRINEMFVAPLNQKDLTGKLMAEIDHPNNCWQFKDEWVGRQEEISHWIDETNPVEKVVVQPFVEGRKVQKLVPPKQTPPNSSAFGRIYNTPPPPPEYTQPVKIEEINKLKIDVNDPVYILMSKSRKIDSEIAMGITISLPPKNLYDIAKESFEDGQKKFVEYIIQDITVDEIKEALKVAITEMYETQGVTI